MSREIQSGRRRAPCVVIGGYVAVLAGIDIGTRGIDVTSPPTKPILEGLASTLEELYAAIRVRAGVPPVSLRADRRLIARAEILNLIPDVGDRVGRGAGGVGAWTERRWWGNMPRRSSIVLSGRNVEAGGARERRRGCLAAGDRCSGAPEFA